MSVDGFKNVEFSGKNSEYFRLCLANFFLSLITLGIYSPWAMVRNKQYLYGHTSMDGHAFGFHADPMKVLKSRIIAFVLFALYMAAVYFNPVLGLIFALVLLCFTPWLIVQSLMFSRRMTSYRNVRFDFMGRKKDAFLLFILYPFLSVFTLYLVLPLVIKKQQEFLISKSKYGNQEFSAKLKTSAFYIMSVLSIILFIAISLPINMIISPLSPFYNSSYDSIVLTYLSMTLAYVVAGSVFYVLFWRHFTKNIQLPDIAKFDTNLPLLGFIGLMVTNLLLVVCTLGIATPIAQIRFMRFKCEHTQYLIADEVENIVGRNMDGTSAFGEEAAGFFDVGVGSI